MSHCNHESRRIHTEISLMVHRIASLACGVVSQKEKVVG